MNTPREYDDETDEERFVFNVSFFLTKEDVDAILSLKNEATDESIRQTKLVIERLFGRIDKRFHKGEQWYQILAQCWRLQEDLASPLHRLAECAE